MNERTRRDYSNPLHVSLFDLYSLCNDIRSIVKAEELEKQPEKAGEKTEVDIEEELRWAEEVKKILKDIGVGFCDELEDKQEEAFDQTDERRYKV